LRQMEDRSAEALAVLRTLEGGGDKDAVRRLAEGLSVENASLRVRLSRSEAELESLRREQPPSPQVLNPIRIDLLQDEVENLRVELRELVFAPLSALCCFGFFFLSLFPSCSILL